MRRRWSRSTETSASLNTKISLRAERDRRLGCGILVVGNREIVLGPRIVEFQEAREVVEQAFVAPMERLQHCNAGDNLGKRRSRRGRSNSKSNRGDTRDYVVCDRDCDACAR